jgi:hypothetical protein
LIAAGGAFQPVLTELVFGPAADDWILGGHMLLSGADERRRNFMSGLGKTLACAVSVVGVAGALAVLAGATTRGPNGQIAFKQALGHPSRLAIVKPDGAPFLQLPRTKQVTDDDPDWSPDASTIAFTRCPLANGPCQVAAMRPNGTGLKRLGPLGDDRAYPAWVRGFKISMRAHAAAR